tara:strand:- start:27465 stop:28799 length:1335 start_codon:yes stop_codon:yes gene_type:complete
MPVNTPNEAYKTAAPEVARVRDCAEGSDAVKAKGDLYLPMLGGQSQEEYNAYRKRGYLMPVVDPTAKALTGAVMRKAPTGLDDVTDMRITDLLKNSDGHGRPLSLLASDAVYELFVAGRYGILSEVTETGVALKTYSREAIINWSSNYIVLQQTYTVEDEKDKFKLETKLEYLELTFDENGLYIQNLWRQKGSGKQAFKIVDVKAPAINGMRLNYLPFEFMNTLEATSALTPPALLPLADVNIDQYRLSTDLRHGLHWTALPTLFVFGEILDEKGKPVKLTVGSGTSNHIQDKDARAELLEFTGAGLNAIDKAIIADVETMSAIGAKLLNSASNVQKSTETTKIEHSGESATLSTIANSVEAGITAAIKTLVEWSDGNIETVSYVLNKDFIDSSLTPQQLTAYLQSYQTGAMSLDTFLNLLHKGELLPQGITPEEEAERIEMGQ